MLVSNCRPLIRRWIFRVLAVEPCVDIEEVDLFRPEESGERLALDALFVLGGIRRVDRSIEVIRLRTAPCNNLIEYPQRGLQWLRREP